MTVIFAFIAGVVTVLSPCVLPLLPILLAATTDSERLKPWGLLVGFGCTFVLITLFLGKVIEATGITPDALRLATSVILLFCGLVLAVRTLGHHVEYRLSYITSGIGLPQAGSGFPGGLLLGASLGVVWTPCVGPIMASVISLALNDAVNGGAFLAAIAYTLGTCIPMAGVIFGGRASLSSVPSLRRHVGSIRVGFGILLIICALLISTGMDRVIQSGLLSLFPAWESALVDWEPSTP